MTYLTLRLLTTENGIFTPTFGCDKAQLASVTHGEANEKPFDVHVRGHLIQS